MNLKEIKKARAQLFEIGSKYGIEKIYVFGSIAREEDTPNSDVDFLVEMPETVSMFGVGGFVFDVGELLGVEVDVIPLSVLMQLEDREFAQKVRAEAVPL
jgi:hypothetical protein